MLRPVRVLLAWFEPHDAVAAQLGFRLPNVREDTSALKAAYQAMRVAVQGRSTFVPEPDPFQPLPEVIASRGETLLKALSSAPGEKDKGKRRAGLVPLRQLLSIQRAVALDEIENRVAKASQDDWESLADLCLATTDSQSEDIRGTFDKDGKGVTISSANPNLRVAPVQSVASAAHGGARFLGFQVVYGTRHLHVARYKGRVFLKDGYHRAYGLLAKGIEHVPCIYEEAEDFQAIHGGGTTLIAPEHLLGPHPPRVADFLDDTVSAQVNQQFFRKVIRIRAEEFVVNV